jgi:hypothetical protein
MSDTPEQTRQMLGCGFAPLPAENLLPHRRVPRPDGYNGIVRTVDGVETGEPSQCPGYLTNLPEVIEVARARFHWSKGGLLSIGVTDWQNDPLVTCIEILEGATNEADRWAFDNPVKK